MSAEGRSVLQTKFFYVASMFAVSLGTFSLMWRFRHVDWTLTIFGLAWVLVVTAFAWEIATRAESLDELVRARTDALEESNRHLSAMWEQLNAFHNISYEITQKMDLQDMTLAFTKSLCDMLPDVDSVWLWLDAQLLGAEPGPREGAEVFPLAQQAGEDLGRPEPLQVLRSDNPLVGDCFQGHSLSALDDLAGKAQGWGWHWLAESGMRSFVGFPLQLGQRMLGLLGVFSRWTMSAGFVSQLNLSVNQLTVALEKARLLEETQRRAEELAAANEELRQLDAMKDWFVSAVSHELRTPLTSVRSFGEILERYEDLEPEERREFATIIRQEGERLSEMIDDMLDLAKIANGNAELLPDYFDLRALVAKCCKLFSQEAEERGIGFGHAVPDELPQVFADEKGVTRVLSNLLGNAFKFTPDGGKIRVTAERDASASEDGGFVRVLVTDTGVGIARRDQSRIFERFTQVGSGLTNKPRGTGIGLAICREIVAKSNGRIWVESEPGRGSTFGFTLPVGPVP